MPGHDPLGEHVDDDGEPGRSAHIKEVGHHTQLGTSAPDLAVEQVTGALPIFGGISR
jgi:hypothetical protein